MLLDIADKAMRSLMKKIGIEMFKRPTNDLTFEYQFFNEWLEKYVYT